MIKRHQGAGQKRGVLLSKGIVHGQCAESIAHLSTALQGRLR